MRAARTRTLHDPFKPIASHTESVHFSHKMIVKWWMKVKKMSCLSMSLSSVNGKMVHCFWAFRWMESKVRAGLTLFNARRIQFHFAHHHSPGRQLMPNICVSATQLFSHKWSFLPLAIKRVRPMVNFNLNIHCLVQHLNIIFKYTWWLKMYLILIHITSSAIINLEQSCRQADEQKHSRGDGNGVTGEGLQVNGKCFCTWMAKYSSYNLTIAHTTCSLTRLQNVCI